MAAEQPSLQTMYTDKNMKLCDRNVSVITGTVAESMNGAAMSLTIDNGMGNCMKFEEYLASTCILLILN